MTKHEILKKHEDLNEYHFHELDREFILQAMQEYTDQQLSIYSVVDTFFCSGETDSYLKKCNEQCYGCENIEEERRRAK